MRRSSSTLHDDRGRRAIVAPRKFVDPISSLTARVVVNLAENAPPMKIVYSFVIYQAKATKFTRISLVA